MTPAELGAALLCTGVVLLARSVRRALPDVSPTVLRPIAVAGGAIATAAALALATLAQ